MKKRAEKLLTALLSAALLLSLCAVYQPGTGTQTAQAADDTFTDLDQDEIVEAMGAGWNLGNQLEASSNGTPDEDAWSGYTVTERMIRMVKQNGFDTIRIPVSYLSMIGDGPDYTIDEDWLDRVQEIVDWAIKYKLYVIINIHGDGYSTVTGGWILPGASDQDTIKAKFEKVWEQIATRFGGYDEHLIFESMNEVGADFSTESEIAAAYENINDYNQIFVDTVRQSGGNNDKRWLLIPGLNTDIDYTAGDYGFAIPTDNYRSSDIPEDEQRLMISVHYYSPWAFCGQEDYTTTQWGDSADSTKTVGYGTEDDMAESFALLKETFTDKGYPVVIGEYGSIDKSTKDDSGVNASGDADEENTECRAYYAYCVCVQSIKNGCVPVYWDNGWNGDFGFAIFDRGTYSVTQTEILNAITGCYSDKEGTATGVTLDTTMLTMDLADDSQTLAAELTPSDSEDTITWDSSDTSVAGVSNKGVVTPKGTGTCLITATATSGMSAYCIVQVTEPKSLKAGLYLTSTYDWNQISGSDYLTVSEDGETSGSISLSGTYNQLSSIGALYLKDVTVEREVAEESVLKSANFTVDSIKLNDTALTMTQDTFAWEKSDDSLALDLCWVNYWYEPSCYISGLLSGTGSSTKGYMLPATYDESGTNTITVELSVTDAVLDIPEQEEASVITAIDLGTDSITVEEGKTQTMKAAITADSDNTEAVLWFTEDASVATVDKSGVVTGVGEGVTDLHALTVSGLDVTCEVICTAADESSTDDSGDDISPGESTNTGTVNSGNGSGTNSASQKVTVKKVKLKSVKSKKKKTATVKWKKVSGVSGYQIKIGRNKKITKGKKTYKVKKAKTTSKTIKKLKSKKKYYVRVRAYKKVNGKTTYGKWSKVKKVKVK